MIVGVSGSPRKQATEYVLQKALHLLEERGFQTKFYTVRGKQIGFCRHCDYCLEHKKCVIADDIVPLYSMLRPAQGLVIATPVYNGGMSAQMKAVLDRSRAFLAADSTFFKHKVGMAIAVGGDRMGGQELALQQIFTFYILNGMIPVSGGAFGANLGGTFWSKDTLAGIKTDKEGFRSLNKTIKRFTQFLGSVQTRK